MKFLLLFVLAVGICVNLAHCSKLCPGQSEAKTVSSLDGACEQTTCKENDEFCNQLDPVGNIEKYMCCSPEDPILNFKNGLRKQEAVIPESGCGRTCPTGSTCNAVPGETFKVCVWS